MFEPLEERQLLVAPAVDSWLLNTTGAVGTSPDPEIEAVVSQFDADVQRVRHNDDNVYINATGIPSYSIGPWDDTNPDVAMDQNYLVQIPRVPVEDTGGPKTATSLGAIGHWVNGVAIYNPEDGNCHMDDCMTYPNWEKDATVFELDGQDAANGHPSAVGGGEYHHHFDPTGIRAQLGDDGTSHSPILGFAYDGFPVYGPYGFDGTDGTGLVRRIESSYQLRSGMRPVGPNDPGGPHNGDFIQDYEYVDGLGDLDEHNGREAVTPEYPEGIYAYYVTLKPDLTTMYPHIIGPEYFGVVIQENLDQTVTVPDDVVDVGPVPVEIIVDNDDGTGVELQGTWFSSTFSAGFFDADYLYSRGVDSDRVTFTPTLTEDGLYEVSARWTTDPNRATNVPITVMHRDGSSETLVNQQQDGGEWISLGEFNLLTGAGHNVMVGTQRVDGIVIADAVQFVRVGDVGPLPEPSDEIIVDNDDGTGVELQGTWFSSTFSAGFYDADYFYSREVDSDKVTFTPTLTEDGLYQVSARWTSHANRATNVPITVMHRDGSSETLVNQQQDGGEWISLGEFNLLAGAGHNAMVGTQSVDGIVIADAVQFVRLGDVDPVPEPSGEIIVDNDDGTGVELQGTWFSSTFSAGFFDADYFYSREVDSDKVTFTPTLTEDGLYQVSARWTSHANRATNVPITVMHRDGSSETLVNQQQDGGEWISLGEFNLLAGAGHNAMVGTQGVDGIVIADAVRFVRVVT